MKDWTKTEYGTPKSWDEIQRENAERAGIAWSLKDYAGCAGLIFVALLFLGAAIAWLLDISIVPASLKTPLLWLSFAIFCAFAAREFRDMAGERKRKLDRAIENTWARVTRIEGELRAALAEARRDGELREQKLLLKISHLEERLASLEQVDLDLFGDDDRPKA